MPDASRVGRDGREIPLDLPAGTPLLLHYSDGAEPSYVDFLGWTGGIDLVGPAASAVARIRFRGGSQSTDTAAAGELSLDLNHGFDDERSA